jgi:hypothetical protein
MRQSDSAMKINLTVNIPLERNTLPHNKAAKDQAGG